MATVRDALSKMTSAAPGASSGEVREAFMRSFGVDLEQVGVEGLDTDISELSTAAPPEPEDGSSSILSGMGKRTLELVAGVPKTLRVAGDVILPEEVAQYAKEGQYDAGERSRFMLDNIYTGPVVNPAMAILGLASKAEKEVEEKAEDIDYVDSVQWEEVKEDPTKLPSFMVEQVALSLPDMAAVSLAGGVPYFLSLVGPAAEQRAKNRQQATGEPFRVTASDLAVAAGQSGAQAALERLGVKAAVGSVPPLGQKGPFGTRAARVGTAAGVGAGQEGVQAVTEYGGSRAGTGAEMSAGGRADEVGPSMLVGGTVGGMLRGATELAAEPVYSDLTKPVDEQISALDMEIPDTPPATPPPTPFEQRQEAKAERKAAEAVAEPPPELPIAPKRAADRPDVGRPLEPIKIDKGRFKETVDDPYAKPEEAIDDLLDELAMQEDAEGGGLYDVRVENVSQRADEYARQAGIPQSELRKLNPQQQMARMAMDKRAETMDLISRPVGAQMEVSAKLKSVIDDASKGLMALTNVQQHAVAQYVKNLGRQVTAILDKAKKGEYDYKDAETKIREIRQEQAYAALAIEMGRRETGRGLATKWVKLRSNMDLPEMEMEAVIANEGALTKKQYAQIKKKFQDVESEINRLSKIRSRAQRAFDKADARLQRLADVEGLSKEGLRVKKGLEKLRGKAARQIVDADRAIDQQLDAKEAIIDDTLHPVIQASKAVFGLSRTFRSALDMSAMGRQGIFMAAGSPYVAAPKAFPKSVVAALSPVRAREINQKILDDIDMPLFELMGIQFTEAEGVHNLDRMSRREEMFAVRTLENYAPMRLLHKIFATRGSQNAFATALNVMRAERAKKWIKNLSEDYGADYRNPQDVMAKVPRRELEGAGAAINISSGRPASDTARKAMSLGGQLMMAPGFTASRIEGGIGLAQLAMAGLSGGRVRLGKFGKLSPKTRLRLLRSFAWRSSFLLGASMSAALAYGGEDWRDNLVNFLSPDSGDFMKLKIGDTRIDLTGGFSTTWRYMIPLLLGPRGSVNFDLDNASEKLKRLAINKSHPVWQTASEWYFNEGYRGNELARKSDDAVAAAIKRYLVPSMKAFAPIGVEESFELGGRVPELREASDTLKEFAAPTGRDRVSSPDLELEKALGILLFNTIGLGATDYKTREGRKRKRRATHERKGR